MLTKEKVIIISLGGSLIYTKDGIRIKFLRRFEEFIRAQVKLGKRFFIVTGGGAIARKYQKAIRETIGTISKEDVDWLGIHATRINGHLLRTIFADIAHPQVISQYEKKEETKEPVTIASGWKPGFSTDYDAVILARDHGAKTIINLSDINVVYDKDPRAYPNASPIETTSWEYYRSLIGKKWEPGLSAPFDPVASKLAQEIGLKVIILKGDNFDNLERLFRGERFKGTLITASKPKAADFNRRYFESKNLGEMPRYISSIITQILTTIDAYYRALIIKFFLQPKSLLDVGCADGKMIFALRKLGVEAYGLDISKYILSKAHHKIGKFLKQGEIAYLPYSDNSFDLVTSFDLLEHISTETLPRVVEECNRVSRQGVLHKIYTSENLWLKLIHQKDHFHVSVFSQSWWEKFFEKQGFSKAKKFLPSLSALMESVYLLEKKP